MSEVPSLVWQHLTTQVSGSTGTVTIWSNPALGPGDPPAVTIPAGYTLKTSVLTLGSASVVYPFDVLVDAGSDAFQWVSGTYIGDLEVGMLVVVTGPPSAVGVNPPNGLPNGLSIVGVNEPTGGSLLLGAGGYLGQTGAPWIYTQPASNTLSLSLDAIDEYPYGLLAATVTPDTGTTITDWNFDGTDNDNNVGDGSAMCNSSGQAMAGFGVTFADAGSYVIEVAYQSYDSGYGDTSGSLAVTVT